MEPLLVAPDIAPVLGMLIKALLWIAAGLVGAAMVAVTLRAVFLRWYFRGNRAAEAIAKNRCRIEEEFDLKLGIMSRSGRARIAAKQTAAWKRAGLADELSNLVHQEITMRFTPGGVTFTSPLKLSDRVEGQPSYDAAKGVLTVGVDTESGDAGTIKLKECSGMVVGALPGAGKTVLLDAMVQALEGHAHVTIFDGKLQTAAEMTPELERLQEIMQARLTSRLDF